MPRYAKCHYDLIGLNKKCLNFSYRLLRFLRFLRFLSNSANDMEGLFNPEWNLI